eukprot:4125857-Lingulodinium_polyedra.AAC.1
MLRTHMCTHSVAHDIVCATSLHNNCCANNCLLNLKGQLNNEVQVRAQTLMQCKASIAIPLPT